MNRLLICLALFVMSVAVVDTASAQHGRRGHIVHHGHAVYHAPHVHHGHVAYRVAPLPYGYAAPYRYGYGASYVYPAYGPRVIVEGYGYPARIYVGGPAFSLRIGF